MLYEIYSVDLSTRQECHEEDYVGTLEGLRDYLTRNYHIKTFAESYVGKGMYDCLDKDGQLLVRVK